MTYCIRRVDGCDPETSSVLHTLHERTFASTAPLPDFNEDYWWLAFDKRDKPVAFAGMSEAYASLPAGYLKRSGVLPRHRGHGLQVRLLRAREAQARKNGWRLMLTDTTKNVPSSNSLIRAGYRLFTPLHPWAFDHSLYWTKDLM